MKQYRLECTYCGKIWEENYLNAHNPPKCGVCGDKNIRIRDNKKNVIDYYAGAPEFQSKPSGYPWNGGD